MVVPAAPILFIVGCTIIDLMILMHDPLPALLGLAVVMCGDPFRRFFLSKPVDGAPAVAVTETMLT